MNMIHSLLELLIGSKISKFTVYVVLLSIMALNGFIGLILFDYLSEDFSLMDLDPRPPLQEEQE